MAATNRVRLIALLSVIPCILAGAQSGSKTQGGGNAGPYCTFDSPERLLGRRIRLLIHPGNNSGLILVARIPDVSGEIRGIEGVLRCRRTKDRLALDVITLTLDGRPVAIYQYEGTNQRVALRVGESVSDTLEAFTVDRKLVEVPVKVTCRNRGAKLELEISPTLDDQPVEFYADANKRYVRYVLKHGEEVPGTTPVQQKSWNPAE